MELIRISECKLKIMLTPTDMCQFELDGDSFGEDSLQMHRSFRLLLEEIHRRTGFDADDRHISVQYFPSREGGCEMFISNLEKERGTPAAALSSPAHERTLQLRPAKRSGGFRKDCAYSFSELPPLLSVCKRLLQIDFACESAAWRGEEGNYFLLLTVPSSAPFCTPEELDFIVEYGTVENAAHLRLYIREHATLICSSNAVFELARLL